MITFGEKIKHLRNKNHLTQKQLGLALGFSENSADIRIAQYESGERKPREDILRKMAKIFNVPLEVLIVPVLSEPREYLVEAFWIQELGIASTCSIINRTYQFSLSKNEDPYFLEAPFTDSYS